MKLKWFSNNYLSLTIRGTNVWNCPAQLWVWLFFCTKNKQRSFEYFPREFFTLELEGHSKQEFYYLTLKWCRLTFYHIYIYFTYCCSLLSLSFVKDLYSCWQLYSLYNIMFVCSIQCFTLFICTDNFLYFWFFNAVFTSCCGLNILLVLSELRFKIKMCSIGATARLQYAVLL